MKHTEGELISLCQLGVQVHRHLTSDYTSLLGHGHRKWALCFSLVSAIPCSHHFLYGPGSPDSVNYCNGNFETHLPKTIRWYLLTTYRGHCRLRCRQRRLHGRAKGMQNRRYVEIWVNKPTPAEESVRQLNEWKEHETKAYGRDGQVPQKKG